MPFKSKAQMKKAFATGGFGGKIDPQEWAGATPNAKKLPERVKPKSRKKKNAKRRDDRALVNHLLN
jgi:hypothetical protein